MPLSHIVGTKELEKWDRWVSAHPQSNLWQTQQWKNFQESLGRETRVYVVKEGDAILASALTIIDRSHLGISTWDIPRGPLAEDPVAATSLLTYIRREANEQKALSLFFSPLEVFPSIPGATPSKRHMQPETTRILNIEGSKEDILAQMKPKGRYNIRLAEKHDVKVTQSQDSELFAALMTATGERDGFRPHSARHYRLFLETIDKSFLLLAHSNIYEEPIAGLIGVIYGSRGIYYYGASSSKARELMAPYALQWQAMHYCKDHGCTSYDLFGIAPLGDANHPWMGVSDFKAKFGGEIFSYPPEQEILLRPLTAKALGLKRKILG